MTATLASRLAETIRTVPDFPKVGILFKDITPLLANPALLRETVDAMCAPFTKSNVSHIVAMESRGFLFGVPMALALDAAFVPARKPGKLPWQTISEHYALEYGQDSLEIHADGLPHGARVLVVDDIVATGGTAAAVCRLVERAGGVVVGISLLGEISGLRNERVLSETLVHSLIKF